MAFLKGPKFDFHLRRASSAGNEGGLDAAQHQELERLYTSTRAGKHFQKDVVKGVDNFTTVGNKQLEISIKMAEDCRKYGAEGPSVRESLKRATTQYGSARNRMEKEREVLHRSLATQVAEPLRTMVHGSPLEDARHLKQKYDRLREDATNQVSEVNRRKTKDPHKDADYDAKLKAAEHKLEELMSAMCTMGRNATTAMGVVESQQQTTTLHKLLAMVDAERAYFQRVTNILDLLHYEIESEVQRSSSTPETPALASPPPPPSRMSVDPPEPSYHTANGDDYEADDIVPTYHTANGNDDYGPTTQEEVSQSFYAVATHDFEGEDEGELTISIGDEVLVRQVTSSGWSEGACHGASGWFPSTYVEKKQRQRRQRKLSGSSHGSR